MATTAARFDSSADGLSLTTGLWNYNSAYTWMAWVYVVSKSGAGYENIYIRHGGGSQGEQLYLSSGGAWALYCANVSYLDVTGSTPSTGTWYHVAVVRDSATSLKLYVNGSATADITNTQSVTGRTDATPKYELGVNSYGEWCNMRLAFARLWTSALSNAEINAEMTATVAAKASEWGDWPLQTDDDDDSGSARNLTPAGTITYSEAGPDIGSSTQTVNANAIASAATVHQPAVTRGAVTVSPNAISSTATVHQPAVSQSGGAQTVNANAIASTTTVYQPVVTRGAVTISAAAIASVAAVHAPWVLVNASNGGLLEVDATNSRYFSVGGAIKVLAGFHTWQTVVDHGATDPPDAFDYDALLDAIVVKGGNFVKLWAAWESLQDWCDAEFYLYPPAYERTGPGNAADGKLKVDLTRPNPVLLERIRARAIEAGNRGLYVCVQLFEGWQVTQKGYAVGTPGVYHPYNAANNINSIDGDVDNDGQVGETRDIGWTAVFNLQKGFVAAVIDAVNDLDNIIYEISNEEDTADETTAGDTVAWQHALIDYIHTYEAGKPKQHPVGMTVLYPGGSDSDLFASNAEWISPKDGSVVTSVTASNGDKVILWDTDHAVGLTDEHEWVWLAFTRGCSPIYMDEWDGGFYGTDTRSTPANELIRANLGYVLDYAARLDLANATPQGSLSSTGYALAKTTGAAQILAYQNTSGAFTVNLTSISGVFSLEWLRTSTGATSAGSNVSGGAVRTLTPPWSGEDVVAFLEKAADEIAPNVIASTATVYQPVVTPGAVTVATNAIGSAAQVFQPAVTVSAVTVNVNVIASGETVYQPAITVGVVTVVTSHLASVAAVYAPVVSVGVVVVSVDAIASVATVYAPALSVGAVSIALNAIASTETVHEPAVSNGLLVTPNAIASTEQVYAVAVTTGAVTVVLNVIGSAEVVHAPSILPGVVAIALEAIGSIVQVYQPAITQSGATVYPDAIVSTEQVYQPAIATGAVTVYLDHVASTATIHAPTVYQGDVQMVQLDAIASVAQVFSVAITAIIAARVYAIRAENRTYAVRGENRTYTVTGE